MGDATMFQGDCLSVMSTLDKVDMVLCDLPYGTTVCPWDVVIPFEPLWQNYRRLIKAEKAIVLTAAQPFTSALVMSAPDLFKYALVWKKSRVSNFAQAPYRFLSEHEDILVFSNGGVSKNARVRMTFNPQGTRPCQRIGRGRGSSAHRPCNKVQSDYLQTTTNYPKSIIEVPSNFTSKHPTEKPVELMAYLIRSYTNRQEVVLDNTMGSGTSGVAALREGRKFIGIEKDPVYFEMACNRIHAEYNRLRADLFP